MRRLGCPILLLAAPLGIAHAQGPADAANPATVNTASPLTITGERPPTLLGIAPDRTLDAETIAGYGLDTIEDLIGQVSVEQGDTDEPPVLLVNGKRVEDAGDVSDYPAEAVQQLQVFPRGAAARLGASATARVYNIVLRRVFRSEILALADKQANDTRWNAQTGTATFTRIKGENRVNATLRAWREGRLLDADLHLVEPAPLQPFDLRGNIVPDPRTGAAEVDPALSALAGRTVTVAPVPTISTPSLADFATGAAPNITDVGEFRTLHPDSRNVDFALSANQRLTDRLTVALNGHLAADQYDSLFGLPSGVAILPAGNDFSPFSRDVGIAIFGRQPLTQTSRTASGRLQGALNVDLPDNWEASLTGQYGLTEQRTDTAEAAFAAGAFPVISDPTFNPFANDLSRFLPLTNQHSTSRSSDFSLNLAFRGALIELPAGPLQVDLDGGWTEARLTSDAGLFGQPQDRRRNAYNVHGAAEIPLTRRDKGARPWMGDLTANLEYGATWTSDVGRLQQASFGLLWAPRPWLHLQASHKDEDRAPDLLFLSGPVIVTNGVPFFDVRTGETVDVTLISGGNPSLGAQKVRTDRLDFTLDPIANVNLQLKGAYAQTTTRGAVSGLPAASVEVLTAFPDRFVRDAFGQLIQVDLRPIALDHQAEQQVSGGVFFSTLLGGETTADGAPLSGPALALRPRLSASLLYTYFLKDEVVIRQGLPVVDLLNGGALGFGGGRPRHQLVGSLDIGRAGAGLQLTGVWRSGTSLATGTTGQGELSFHPFGTLNLRAFTDLRSTFPGAAWAKGLRLAFTVTNLADARQRVVDPTGATPLSFQPGNLDPLGRTYELELRKAF